MDIKFGTKKTIQQLDENKSTKTTIETFKEGKLEYPIREEYTINVRVRNALEEAAEYHKFSKEYNTDPTMRNPSSSIKKSRLGNNNGYYYFIKKWESVKH